MKIGQSLEIPGAGAPSGLARQAKAPATAAEGAVKDAAAAPAAGVPVTVSTTVRALDPAQRSSGVFDSGKVKAVREAIDNGTFSVDAEAVADKLLAGAQEIIVRSRG
jgi:negative regulator of flagellin synthesis FlgM